MGEHNIIKAENAFCISFMIRFSGCMVNQGFESICFGSTFIKSEKFYLYLNLNLVLHEDGF